MKGGLRHNTAIILLGIFILVKIFSIHSFIHIIEGEDFIVENCIECEYQLQINELPGIDSHILEIKKVCFTKELNSTIFYVSPFTSNNSTYAFSNKAPPYSA